jgi:hypothetical protein
MISVLLTFTHQIRNTLCLRVLEPDLQLLALVHAPIDLVDLPPDLGLPLLVRRDGDLDNAFAWGLMKVLCADS